MTRSKRTSARLLSATLLAGAISVGAFAAPAAARDGDIVVRGDCSSSSTAKLKLGPRESNSETEVDFEVDQNVNGSIWRVALLDNGERFLRRRYTTQAPSGSFSVETAISGASGHRVVARAVNLGTGETCRLVAKV